MKKIQIISIMIITIFSFFYTEKISNLTLEKNKIYQEIKKQSNDFEIKPVNAQIINNEIIPGLNGKKVNIKNSFYNMIDINAFNSYYLLYDITYPEISINNNKDKIISQGNSQKNSVSFITNAGNNIIEYFNESNYPLSILTDITNFDKTTKFEQINNEINNFNKLENILNKNNKNTNICYINDLNFDICKKNQKYLIKTNKTLNNQTFIKLKNNINSGDIYYIDSTLDKKNIQFFINAIKYKDLKIVSITNLISEENN